MTASPPVESGVWLKCAWGKYNVLTATAMIFEKGVEYEKRYLTAFKARGLVVVEVKAEGFDLAERTALARKSIPRFPPDSSF
jgi:hypothetical protein